MYDHEIFVSSERYASVTVKRHMWIIVVSVQWNEQCRLFSERQTDMCNALSG